MQSAKGKQEQFTRDQTSCRVLEITCSVLALSNVGGQWYERMEKRIVPGRWRINEDGSPWR